VTERSVRIVFVTAPEAETLEAIGRILVNEGLAAVYRWEGRVRSDAEALAMIKTTGDRIEEARARLGELHPYEVPEFVAVEVAEGSPAYLNWVRDSVTERDGCRSAGDGAAARDQGREARPMRERDTRRSRVRRPVNGSRSPREIRRRSNLP